MAVATSVPRALPTGGSETVPAEGRSLAYLRGLLDNGDATSVELVESALKTAEDNRHLNAMIKIDGANALARARDLDSLRTSGQLLGPLHGLPIVIKDNIHVAGLPNSAGTPGLKDFVPDEDSPVVASLRAAGAINIGKANLHEMAFGVTSANVEFGTVGNPAAPGMLVGGSSGGTASAVAAGIVAAGLGTDTAGSCRIPASLTSTVGFRPSSGRYPQSGVTPLSNTRDTIGVISRCVSDVLLLDSVITADDSPLPPVDVGALRIGVDRDFFFSNLDKGTDGVIEAALQSLASAGVEFVNVSVPLLAELLSKSGWPILMYELFRDLSSYLQKHKTGLNFRDLASRVASPDVQAVFSEAMGDEAVPETAYLKALAVREQLMDTCRAYFEDNNLDALAFPTTILPARPLEGSRETVELNGSQVPPVLSYIHNTDPGSVVGLPGLSIPAGRTPQGLPVGLEIDGPASSDRRLLAIGLAVEQVLQK